MLKFITWEGSLCKKKKKFMNLQWNFCCCLFASKHGLMNEEISILG